MNQKQDICAYIENISNEFYKTEHFLLRQAQRKITDAEIALTLTRGRRFYEGQEQVYFLCRKNIPKIAGERDFGRRASGTVVVVGPDRALITTYRNARFLRDLKRRH